MARLWSICALGRSMKHGGGRPPRWCRAQTTIHPSTMLPSPTRAGLLQMSKEAEEVLLLPFRLSHFAGGGSFVRVGVEDVEGEASDDGKVFGGVILAGA